MLPLVWDEPFIRVRFKVINGDANRVVYEDALSRILAFVGFRLVADGR